MNEKRNKVVEFRTSNRGLIELLDEIVRKRELVQGLINESIRIRRPAGDRVGHNRILQRLSGLEDTILSQIDSGASTTDAMVGSLRDSLNIIMNNKFTD